MLLISGYRDAPLHKAQNENNCGTCVVPMHYASRRENVTFPALMLTGMRYDNSVRIFIPPGGQLPTKKPARLLQVFLASGELRLVTPSLTLYLAGDIGQPFFGLVSAPVIATVALVIGEIQSICIAL